VVAVAIKRIDIRKLKIGMCIAAPVYKEQNGRRVLLMSENSLIINEGQIRRIAQSGASSVEIDTDKGIDTFTTLLQQKKWDELAKTSADPNVTEALVARHSHTFITSTSMVVTRSVTSRVLIGENRVALILKDILETVQLNIDLLLAMNRLRTLNEYTYAHSVNVTVLCISLGIELGMNVNDITRFGTGTLLADIGMSNYPSSLTRRPSGLSRREKEEIKKHPIYTLDFLGKVGIDDKVIEKAVLQHHERFDGSGYPYGLKGEEIYALSRLFAIADVYIAMTSSRPHRSGFPPHLVLAEILQMSGALYDPAMTEAFIKHVGVFPVGNMVELTSGRFGIVASTNKADPLRPVVIVFTAKKKLTFSEHTSRDDEDNYILTLGRWELIDLAREGSEFGRIKRGVDHRKFRIKPQYYLERV
jgi:HD-GYP domain-containing protein (c-di-GMP phosphodiesterase class II)